MIKQLLAYIFAVSVVGSTNFVVNAKAEIAPALVMSGIQIAIAIIPIIDNLYKESKKECRQVSYLISTAPCYKYAATRAQNEIFQGRDEYSVESFGSNGAWVRCWRVRTGASQSQTTTSGKCSNGKKFTVSNCQTTGKVHC